MSEKPGLCRYSTPDGNRLSKCGAEDPNRFKGPKEVPAEECMVDSPDGKWILQCPDPAGGGKNYCEGVRPNVEGDGKLYKLTGDGDEFICVTPEVLQQMQKYNIK